jgi:hypothetical protein
MTGLPPAQVSVGSPVTRVPTGQVAGTAWTECHHVSDELVAHDDVAIGVPCEYAGRSDGLRVVHVVHIGRADCSTDRTDQRLTFSRHWIGGLTDLQAAAPQHHSTHVRALR